MFGLTIFRNPGRAYICESLALFNKSSPTHSWPSRWCLYMLEFNHILLLNHSWILFATLNAPQANSTYFQWGQMGTFLLFIPSDIPDEHTSRNLLHLKGAPVSPYTAFLHMPTRSLPCHPPLVTASQCRAKPISVINWTMRARYRGSGKVYWRRLSIHCDHKPGSWIRVYNGPIVGPNRFRGGNLSQHL